MGVIGPEHMDLFALKLRKIAEFDFDYTLESTNINKLVPNLVKIYLTIRSEMILIMSELSALELENLLYLTLFTL